VCIRRDAENGNDKEVDTEGNEGNEERQENLIFVAFVTFCAVLPLNPERIPARSPGLPSAYALATLGNAKQIQTTATRLWRGWRASRVAATSLRL
jgi:hypothetical protein